MDWIREIWQLISDSFQSMCSALNELLTALNTQIDSIDTMKAAIETGHITGFNWLKWIGAYHYIVGDFIYMSTYTVIIIGVLMTIYKIILLIKENINLGDGLLSKVKAFFK